MNEEYQEPLVDLDGLIDSMEKQEKQRRASVEASERACEPIRLGFYSYVQWSKASVYFDDISAKVQAQVDRHNRLVLVLQGLLDRSPVFHPHPPWKIWNADGMAAAMELLYDESRALVSGPKPDFEAYRARLNRSIKAGSRLGDTNLSLKSL